MYVVQDIDRKQDAAASDIRKYTKKLHQLQGWGEEVISVELAHQVAIRQVEMMREVPAAAHTARHSMCLVEVEQEVAAVRKRFQKVSSNPSVSVCHLLAVYLFVYLLSTHVLHASRCSDTRTHAHYVFPYCPVPEQQTPCFGCLLCSYHLLCLLTVHLCIILLWVRARPS